MGQISGSMLVETAAPVVRADVVVAKTASPRHPVRALTKFEERKKET
jgi:hypothetical protein